MQLTEAATLDRKSGKPTCPGLPWRDLQFRGPFLEMFFDRVAMGRRPTQGDEKRFGLATPLYGTVARSFIIPIACDFFDLFVFSA